MSTIDLFATPQPPPQHCGPYTGSQCTISTDTGSSSTDTITTKSIVTWNVWTESIASVESQLQVYFNSTIFDEVDDAFPLCATAWRELVCVNAYPTCDISHTSASGDGNITISPINLFYYPYMYIPCVPCFLTLSLS
jgi:hypothetical protein